MSSQHIQMRPGDLLLPQSRIRGADPEKLRRQIEEHGFDFRDMPPISCYELADSGELMIWDGVTRATRAAMLAPNRLVSVEILGKIRLGEKQDRIRVKDRLHVNRTPKTDRSPDPNE